MALAKSRCSSESGFSLIEVLAAMVVLSVSLVSLAQLFALSTRNNFSSRSNTYAALLAQQKMEQLRTLPWSAPDLVNGTHPGLSGETLTLQDEGTFNRRWIVVDQAGNFADMKRVTVRVRWTVLRPDSVELVSYFRR